MGRARKIIQDKQILKLGKHTFEVRSQSRDKAYLIDLHKPECGCEDWAMGHICKHITACMILLLDSEGALPVIPRPPKSEPPQPQPRITWNPLALAWARAQITAS